MTITITTTAIPKSMIGVTAASRIAEVSPSTIRAWAESERLEACRLEDGPLRLDKDDVAAAAAALLLKRNPERALQLYTAEIVRRGGEITIDGRYGSEKLEIISCRGDLAVLHAEGWRQYSRRFGARRAHLSYLCGSEDGQLWAVRIPGTITGVGSALDWVTPAEVLDARSRGKRVQRQGDVYAIETTKAHDGKGSEPWVMPRRHTWDPESRTLSHPQHRTLNLPYPVRFVRQRVYEMGRSGGRGWGD